MAETQGTAKGVPVEGRMFLYKQPELLTSTDHGTLGIKPVERPFEFVSSVRAAPLVSVEFGSAQKHYPIVFTDTDVPLPVAILGVVDDANLFVDEGGNWERGYYVPTYIRCHPIGFATGPNEQLAVVIDRAAATVSAEPEVPFFEGEKLSAEMQKRVDFCASYNAERKRTVDFCTRLKELDLFVGQQVNHQPRGGGDETSLGAYVAVHMEKLGNLDTATIAQLHKDGSLSAIYAHVFSLENWSRLLDRRAQRGTA